MATTFAAIENIKLLENYLVKPGLAGALGGADQRRAPLPALGEAGQPRSLRFELRSSTRIAVDYNKWSLLPHPDQETRLDYVSGIDFLRDVPSTKLKLVHKIEPDNSKLDYVASSSCRLVLLLSSLSYSTPNTTLFEKTSTRYSSPSSYSHQCSRDPLGGFSWSADHDIGI
jgi:hypothetical protein